MPPSLESPWRDRLYRRFRESGVPVVIVGESVIPAATLWVCARAWVAAFRAAGVGPGTRVVLSAAPDPAFVPVLIAALWEGLTLVPAAAGADLDAVAEEVDAALIVGAGPSHLRAVPESVGMPPATFPILRPTQLPPADVRFLFQTSGTTGAPRWVALSDANVLAVLDSHLPELPLADRRVLAALPWHHTFGLVLDLLASLLAGAIVVRDPNLGRDPVALLALAQRWGCDWLSGVPYLIRRVWDAGGESFLRGLAGGIVGGSAVSPDLAGRLAQTRLRAGYGQTEAGPGVALGAPGAWRAGYLGRPLGCRVRLTADGELWYSGPNACAGFWDRNGFAPAPADRWVNSHDTAQELPDGGLVFMGRSDDRLKLDNGRFVSAPVVERLIQEACPQVRDVLVTTGGGDLRVWWSGAPAPDLAAVAARLGPLGGRLRAAREVRPDEWVRTPKGEIARRFTAHKLTG